jgi:hypothetical protein
MFAPDCKFWTLQEALDVAERELKRRESVFPSLVRQGKLSQEKADYEIAAQRYIIQIIEARIHAHEGYRNDPTRNQYASPDRGSLHGGGNQKDAAETQQATQGNLTL